LEAIGHGFDGRSVMDGCVVREKVRYFCTYLTKNEGPHQPLTLPQRRNL
jgi:hypothetical protein